MKAGVYYNNMHVEATTALGGFIRRFNSTSFVGEVGAMAIFEFTPYSSFRIGYQGLWMEGAALVYDQYD
ncbi:MAG: hypothetical protein MK104_16480, partial [Erythrobacter sp.]|nr:hypothetical protein [Erythrobacter sp.]